MADEIIPLLEEPKQQQHQPANWKQEREIKRVSQVITASCQFSVVLAIVAAVILFSAFLLAKAVPEEQRVYGLTIIGVIFLGIFAVLIVAARKDSTTLLFFTNLALLITGFSLGISACLFFHIVTTHNNH